MESQCIYFQQRDIIQYVYVQYIHCSQYLQYFFASQGLPIEGTSKEAIFLANNELISVSSGQLACFIKLSSELFLPASAESSIIIIKQAMAAGKISARKTAARVLVFMLAVITYAGTAKAQRGFRPPGMSLSLAS